MVDVLLGASATEARGEGTARGSGKQAGLKPCSLGVVMHVVDNHTPLPLDVTSTLGHGVHHVGGAEIAFRTRPVCKIVRRVARGSACVVGVVEALLLLLGDPVHQVVGGLGGDVGVLLQENDVGVDVGLDLVLGVLFIIKAVAQGGVLGAGRGHRRVAVGVVGVDGEVAVVVTAGLGIRFRCCCHQARHRHKDCLREGNHINLALRCSV